MKKFLIVTVSCLCAFVFISRVSAEQYHTKKIQRDTLIKKYGDIYNPEKADCMPIPDVLERLDGKGRVLTADEWINEARPQAMDYIDEEMYGEIPPRASSTVFELVESSDGALDGIAERRQYKATVSDKEGSLSFDILVYLPRGAKKGVPAFVCPNFGGNHTISPESEVLLPKCRLRTVKNNIATNEQRATKLSRIPVKDIVSRGFAIATFCYCELYPDEKTTDAATQSLYKIFARDSKFASGPAIVAWAWGDMRVMDLLETIPQIDKKRVAVVGHSRLGKTALIAGTHDLRFGMVCSSKAGCMGESLSKRKYGETISTMVNINFPYWFSKNLNKYADNEQALKIDQHFLLACVAPRPLYICAASEDYWADPEGQLKSLILASAVYKLFGRGTAPTIEEGLAIERPFHGDVGWHILEGRHNITQYDWKNFMDFAVGKGWKPVKPIK